MPLTRKQVDLLSALGYEDLPSSSNNVETESASSSSDEESDVASEDSNPRKRKFNTYSKSGEQTEKRARISNGEPFIFFLLEKSGYLRYNLLYIISLFSEKDSQSKLLEVLQSSSKEMQKSAQILAADVSNIYKCISTINESLQLLNSTCEGILGLAESVAFKLNAAEKI